MVRPVAAKYPVTLGYRQKMRSNPSYIHRGIDYGAPAGTPVVATKGGTVVYVGSGGGNGPACGLHVIIKTSDGIHCAYYHLSAENVRVDERVATGQQLGKVGSTGNSTGPHLHYQEQTGGPGHYKTDRRPQFIDYTDKPVDKMNPNSYFVGASGDHVLWLGQRLEAHGHGENYTPTRDFTTADVKKVAEFQRAQGWSGAAADGLPGPETLKRLAAAPKPQASATLPAQVLDLRNWKLTLPFGKPTEIKQPALARFADARCFFVRQGGVVFRANAGGAHTSGSKYPRSELRQMDGSKGAAWSNKSGTHTMTISQAITAIPHGKAVVAGQIHDSEDDVVRIVLKGRTLYASFSAGKGKDKPPQVLDSNYRLGARFVVQIVADHSGVAVFYNGTRKAHLARTVSGAFWKSGVYTLSDDDADGYGEVVIYSLAVTPKD